MLVNVSAGREYLMRHIILQMLVQVSLPSLYNNLIKQIPWLLQSQNKCKTLNKDKNKTLDKDKNKTYHVPAPPCTIIIIDHLLKSNLVYNTNIIHQYIASHYHIHPTPPQEIHPTPPHISSSLSSPHIHIYITPPSNINIAINTEVHILTPLSSNIVQITDITQQPTITISGVDSSI